MDVAIALLTLLLVALVVMLVSAPLRSRRGAAAEYGLADARGAARGTEAPQISVQREELEAAREAKYREIRDSELDFRTGKLSRADYDAIDAQLRSEAIDILDRLDKAQAEGETSVESAAHGSD